jgi:hypothetical protein
VLWCSADSLPRCVTLEPREMIWLIDDGTGLPGRDRGRSIPCSTPTWIKGVPTVPAAKTQTATTTKKDGKKEKRKKERSVVDLSEADRSRCRAPRAPSPLGRGVFRMSLRASQVGKPRRQLSTSSPESAIAARALTLLFTLPPKHCNPQTKPPRDPLPQAEWKFLQFPQTPPPGLPIKTAIVCPGRYGYRARKRDSGFHALTNAGRGCLDCLPSSRCGDSVRPPKHFVALKIVNKGSGANNKTTSIPSITKG